MIRFFERESDTVKLTEAHIDRIRERMLRSLEREEAQVVPANDAEPVHAKRAGGRRETKTGTERP